GSPSPSDPASQAPVRLDPGDLVTVTASLGFKYGALSGTMTGTVSDETDTKVDGQPLFRAGMRFLAARSWSLTWPDTFGVSTLTASYAHANKNKVLFIDQHTLAPVAFDTEPFNSNSNVYRVGIEHMFTYGQFAIGPTASYLRRDQNSYDSITLQFVPAKERKAVGALARFAPSEKISFNARVERVWTKEHDSLGANFSLLLVPPAGLPIPGVPQISSNGWQFAGGATIVF